MKTVSSRAIVVVILFFSLSTIHADPIPKAGGLHSQTLHSVVTNISFVEGDTTLRSFRNRNYEDMLPRTLATSLSTTSADSSSMKKDSIVAKVGALPESSTLFLLGIGLVVFAQFYFRRIAKKPLTKQDEFAATPTAGHDTKS